MKLQRFFYISIFIISSTGVHAAGPNRLTTEVGIVEPSYNRVAVPGDDGTDFNMRKSLPQSSVYYRLDYKRTLGDKHGMRFLYSPLRLTGDRRYSEDIEFDGEEFQNGEKTKTLYQFNSYRATYFYQWINEEKWKLNIGFTGKIRDAKIRLKQDDLKRTRSDLGFVPLLYLWSEYDLTDKVKLTFDFDGLAAPQGRAFDIALSAGYRFTSEFALNIGYRMLEGGVDNDKVYNFSQFNFLFGALEFNF